MLSFYVNEDRPTNRATVHVKVCPWAQVRTKKPGDGRWHGPFPTTGEALDTAQGTGLIARLCGKCKPRFDLSILT